MPNHNSKQHRSLCDQFNAAGQSTVLVFDLDNTIVDIATLFGQMETLYTQFIAQRLNLSERDAHIEVKDMLKHGYYVQDQALIRHGIPVADTLQATYDPQNLDLRGLSIDPQVKIILDSISCKKYILTNATRPYANAVIQHLGIKDCFEGVSGIDDFQFMRKPQIQCFDQFEVIHGLAGKDVHFFEDTPGNIASAHFQKGWSGHLIEGHRPTPAFSSGTPLPSYICSRMDTLLDLK